MEDVRKIIGDRIRQLRKERGLSQENLGYKSDLHYTHIGAIERGEKNWSIDTLVKVARGLNITVSELLSFSSKSEDVKNMKKTVITEINTSSPETLNLFSGLLKNIKAYENSLTIPKKSYKK